jgi:thiol:disulfide interchange protein DsbA
MKKSLALIALALMAAAACSREPAANTVAALPPAASAGIPAAAPAAAKAPAAAQEAANGEAGANREDAALERVAALPPEGQLPAGRWVAGKHYRPLVPAQPTNVSPGKVEVVEMFWYACTHCYALDPFLESWRKTKPAYIEFVRIPVMWQETHRAHARLFYTLQALGKEDALHTKVFSEIHERKNPLVVPGDEQQTLQVQLAFAKANGISETDFLKAYNSFTVQTNLQKAEELGRRYKADGVPMMVVNGKYVTDVGMADGQSNLIAIVNDLAASEKRR